MTPSLSKTQPAAPAAQRPLSSSSNRFDGWFLKGAILAFFVGLAVPMTGLMQDYRVMAAERNLTAEQCVAQGGDAVQNGNRVSCKRADGTWRQLVDG